MTTFQIWTDGSALDTKNPSGSPGGLGIIVIYNGIEYEKSLGFFKTTNNRMELLSIALSLEEIQTPSRIEICSDSEYSIFAVTKWVHSWIRNNWHSGSGKPVQNKDLIIRIRNMLKFHDVKFTKVKAHSGIYYNERVDKLAKNAAKHPTEVDVGYINRMR